MKNRILSYIITALISVLFAADLSANGQTSAFTYQGSLKDGGTPAEGLYDFQFTLFAASSGGGVVEGPQALDAVEISGGLFCVELDFGSAVFDGSDLWLQIGVVTNNGPGYTLLSPRQQITATPYAIKAGDASTLAGSGAGDFALDAHSHSGGDIDSGTVGAAYIDSLIARDSELTWGNLAGIPADIADGDQVGVISESDPQVGSNTANYVPKWNGSALVSGTIYDNGSKIGIGTGGTALDKLEVAGDLSMNSTPGGGVVFRFRKDDAQNWAIMTAPWLNGNDSLWIRNEAGPYNIMAFDKTSNRVGIHTTDPQATLHVNGDLRVDGSIAYGTSKTGYASVAAAAFHPSASSFSYNNTGGFIYPSSPTVTFFYAGISLPHEATVTSVQWTGGASGEGSHAQLTLYRRNLAGSGLAMGTCYWSGSGFGELTDTSISGNPVDNSQYVYHLEMLLDETGGACSGGAVIVTYTCPGP